MTATKPNYKKTLNLPKTPFPMRANLAQNEPQSMKRWDGMKDSRGNRGLHDVVNQARRDDSATGFAGFIFHDGPPYANASIHMGHLLNKILKDLVVRSQLLSGKACPFIPGWDCHGLPIEHMVMGKLVESGKIDKINDLEPNTRRMAIRGACRDHAEKEIKRQKAQMQRLLTLADYENPYLTMNPQYEAAVLDVFAELVEQGLVYRALKPVHWSIANQTALAEAELEYQDREDLSVYVLFECVDGAKVREVFDVSDSGTGTGGPIHLMIWTTTPWTLPANLAVAVHERFRYALVKVRDRLVIVAAEMVKRVMDGAGIDPADVEVIAETDGANLLGLIYQHPFCDRTSPVVAADYVTLEDGTGLVHTAPGHGTDDYQTGLREGLDTYCPVRGDGTYDETVPDWLRGRSIWDANSMVTERLRESGHLFYDHTFMHSYPHDWRSKTPVIFRCTEQWFIAVDENARDHGRTLREMGQKAAEEEVNFVPKWGRNRLKGMLESRPDWCISRQRAWGLPIPAFVTPDGEVILTPATVKAVGEAFRARGSDAWFTESAAELLATWDAASDEDLSDDLRGVDVGSLEKMYDIFDVWFESGSSWNAVMRQRDLGYPVDLYLEGSDQHRGWFQLSLLPGLGVTGQPPFQTLLTHGFINDKDGRKMSKSGGNAISVEDVLKAYGADVARWWVSSLSYENDIKADISFLDVAGDTYRKVRNTLRFLLSNLADFVPCTANDDGMAGMCIDLSLIPPTSIDAYIVEQTRRLQDQVVAAYQAYDFRRANQLLYDFCNETLSAFYCAAVKDRLYCDKPDSPRRRVTQTVMWDVLEVLCRLLAPILPHTADEAYRALWSNHGGDEDQCVHTQTLIDLPEIEIDPRWDAVMAARDAGLKALEDAKARGVDNPLDAEIVFVDRDGALRDFAADLPDMLGVSRVSFTESGEIAVNDLSDEPRCERSWKRDGTVRERSDGGMLTDRDAEAVGV